MLDYLKGRKTYLAAAGMALLGLVDLMNGDSTSAMQKFLMALGFAGLRNAVPVS